MRVRPFAAALCTLFAVAGPAAADDWVALKLRGNVFMQQGTQWVRMKLNDVVSDSRIIKTLADGRVQLTRDGETIDVSGSTELQIHDQAGRRFTTVSEAMGQVSIEANVERVQHFAVDTPYIAAVVKGTKFTVRSGVAGSKVDVTRGRVGVEDRARHLFVDVLVGQHASAGPGQPLSVGGSGTLQPITDSKGKVVPATSRPGEATSTAAAVATSGSSEDNNNANTTGNGNSSGNGNSNGSGKSNGNGSDHGNSGGNGNSQGSSGSGESGDHGNGSGHDNGGGNGGVNNGHGNGKN